MANRAEILKQQFTQSLGLACQAFLPVTRLEALLKDDECNNLVLS